MNHYRDHFSERAKGGFTPKPKGRKRLCGCGNHTSTPKTRFIKGHRPPLPIKVRIWRNCIPNPETGCWEWQISKTPNGYASINIDGKNTMAHRVSYEAFVGPIPNGLTIDHLCRVRHCLNPEHMEPVTRGENSRRAGGLQVAWERRRKGAA